MKATGYWRHFHKSHGNINTNAEAISQCQQGANSQYPQHSQRYMKCSTVRLINAETQKQWHEVYECSRMHTLNSFVSSAQTYFNILPAKFLKHSSAMAELFDVNGHNTFSWFSFWQIKHFCQSTEALATGLFGDEKSSRRFILILYAL